MPRANYTLAAEFDLGQIVDRIAEENVSAAVNWISKTRAICELLADQPELGQRSSHQAIRRVTTPHRRQLFDLLPSDVARNRRGACLPRCA